jgi:uncharacterized membrane protein
MPLEVASMLRKLSSYFLAGLLALLPLIITVAVVSFLYGELVRWVGPQSHFGRFVYSVSAVTTIPAAIAYVLTFLAVVALILAFGLMATRITGRRLRDLFNSLIARIPFVNKVYGSAEQVVQLFQSHSADAVSALGHVVLARFANTQVLGVLANNERVDVGGVPHLFFYMPHAPLPATGGIYLVPEADITYIEMSVEDMTRVQLSLGSLGPGAMKAGR